MSMLPKKIKYYLLFVLFCGLLFSAHAQDGVVSTSEYLALPASETDSLPALTKPSRHSIIVELGGASVFYSLGYENIFFSKKRIILSGKVGIEYFPFRKTSFGFPMHIGCNIGNKKTKFFTSVGALIIIQKPEPMDSELRKKIRSGNLGSNTNLNGTNAGIDYIPTIQLPPAIGIGVHRDIERIYIRLTANALCLYRLDTIRQKYIYNFFPWGGITIGLKL